MKKKIPTNNRRRIDDTHYSNIFENNVNFKERVIYINDEISDYSLDLILKSFDELERGEGSDKPIRIEVSSFGGSVYDMLGIVDRIKSSPCHVVTRGFGYIMSAAVWILMAGDERVVGSNSWLMIHETSEDLGWNKLSGHKTNVKHTEQLEEQMYQMLADLSTKNIKKATFKKLCQKDYYMNAKEALKYGLIEKILGESDEK